MGMRLFNKLPVWFITFVFFFFFFSVFTPASSSQCQDGMYKHDGRHCCLCGAGQYRVKHCSTNLTYGECTLCEAGTYRDQPNAEKNCEPCTSCAQENANLEVAENCTRARNSKCQCKKDHYCIKDDTDVCKLCYPCNKCDAEGIKEACTGYSNAVCNDKIEGGNQGGMIAGIIVAIIGIGIGIVCVVVFLRKRRHGKRQDPESNGKTKEEEMQPLKGVDIQHHRSDIAEVIGWKVMKDLATRSGIADTVIDNCQQNHPHDAQEQTVELLKVWGERQGRGASEELLNMLRRTSKKDKYEKVKNILAPGP